MAGSAKTPTTSVRRLISLFSRSRGLVDQIFFQWATGKAAKASSSGSASRQHGLDLAELAAEHAGDHVELIVDVRASG